MKISESLLPEYDQESANTRRMLERVPEDKLEWRAHPKSYTMAALATHLATIAQWGSAILEGHSYDVASPDAKPPEPARTRKEILEVFDAGTAKFRAQLTAAEDARLLEPWSLVKGSENIFTMPRIAVIRSFILNHAIHHRAQLGVYLRLNNVPVPGVYGPSADEQ
jgi:uncharacterized damage-inducible protein DinB